MGEKLVDGIYGSTSDFGFEFTLSDVRDRKLQSSVISGYASALDLNLVCRCGWLEVFSPSPSMGHGVFFGRRTSSNIVLTRRLDLIA